jgi:enhancer of polycomb-like protein
VQSQDVWEKRLAFADLKLKFPMLNDKVDEELLVDKERPVKKPDASYVTLVFVVFICNLTVIVSRRGPLKLRPHDDPPPRPEVLLRPKERVTMIRDLVETTLTRQKDLDLHWEDQVDVSYFLYVTQSLRILIS